MFTSSRLPSMGMVALGALQLATSTSATLQICSSSLPVSCQNTTAVTASCCFNSPGGTLMQTQFWDTDPATGPSDSWTIHGLWPDNCDGTYAQYCDPSREYSNISAILEAQDRTDLLSYMNEYWLSDDGDNESFWSHEWNKHGTCINTIEPSCYTNYHEQEEVGDFFQKVVDLFRSLDTYKALADAGITPSESATYSLRDVQRALASLHDGYDATLVCSNGALNQVYYYFNIQGNAIDGTYVAIDPLESSDCPSTVKYLPKSG